MSHPEFEEQDRLEAEVKRAARALASYMGCGGFKLPMGNGCVLVFGPVERMESLSGAKDGQEAVASLIAKVSRKKK